MPYIDIRIHVSADEETYKEEKWVNYEITGISQVGTDLPEGVTDQLQERLAQTDFGSLDFNQGVITSLNGTPVHFKR